MYLSFKCLGNEIYYLFQILYVMKKVNSHLIKKIILLKINNNDN
jgi:hypothetical protein